MMPANRDKSNTTAPSKGGSMRKCFYILIALGILAGCVPSFISNRANRKMDEVMARLVFKIDRIQPKMRAQLPISQSGLDLNIDLAIVNPTDEKINAQSFAGKLEIIQQGVAHTITQTGNITQTGIIQQGVAHTLGDISISKVIVVPKRGSVIAPISLEFKYNDIRKAWKQVANIALGHQTTWKVRGDLEVKAFGTVHKRQIDLSEVTGSKAETIQADQSGQTDQNNQTNQSGQSGRQLAINEGLSNFISDGFSVLSGIGSSILNNVDDALTKVAEANHMVISMPSAPPAWPDEVGFARSNPPGRYTERVRVRVSIGADGRQNNIEVISGPGGFHKNAVDYVKQYKFRAQTGQDGQPRAYEHIVNVLFELVVQ